MTQLHSAEMGNGPEPTISRRLAERLLDLAYTDDSGQLQVVDLHEGEILFEQGDEAQSMFVVKAGMLGVRVRHADGRESNIARIAPGAIVGEMALLSGSRRSATVYAINDAGLICITRDHFERLMMEDETALVEMTETAVPRWQKQQLFNALHTLLGDADEEGLEALQQQVTWHFFKNGEVVYLQGDEADGMYIVVNGRLRASLLQEDGSVKDIGRIGPGEPVGDMAVITESERSATIHAVRESNLVHISPAKFQRLIRQHPRLLINIARVIIERQQRIMRGTEAQPAGPLSLVVIPTSLEQDTILFARQLSAALGQYGQARALDGDAFDQRYGEEMASQTELDDIGNTAIVAFMNELDLKDKYLVYAADPFASAWTRRCIGHADRAIVLADPATDPQPGDAERLLDELVVPLERDLVFWLNAGQPQPPDVKFWLETRSADGYIALQKGDVGAMEALVAQLINSN